MDELDTNSSEDKATIAPIEHYIPAPEAVKDEDEYEYCFSDSPDNEAATPPVTSYIPGPEAVEGEYEYCFPQKSLQK